MARGDDQFLAAAGFVAAAMTVPLLVAVSARDVLALYLTHVGFTLLVGLAFGLAAWTLLEVADVDRPSLLVASVAVPAASVVAIPLLTVAVLAAMRIEHFSFPVSGGPFGYAGTFVVSGAAAVAVSRGLDRSAGAHRPSWLPEPRRALLAVWAVLLVGLAIAAGANHLAGRSATVATVQPGLADELDPALAVAVDGPPAELRLTVTAPGGAAATRRIPATDMASDRTRVAVRVVDSRSAPPDRLPLRVGTYRVRLSTLGGVTVDRATYTVEAAPSTAILAAETVREPTAWTAPALRSVGSLPERPAYVGVVLERTAGAFPTRPPVRLLADGERVEEARPLVEPGDPATVVFTLGTAEVAELQRAHDGTARVVVGPADGATAATAVSLPPARGS